VDISINSLSIREKTKKTGMSTLFRSLEGYLEQMDSAAAVRLNPTLTAAKGSSHPPTETGAAHMAASAARPSDGIDEAAVGPSSRSPPTAALR